MPSIAVALAPLWSIVITCGTLRWSHLDIDVDAQQVAFGDDQLLLFWPSPTVVTTARSN
jgi:hypothetical protein